MSDYARDAVWGTKGLSYIQRLLLLAIAENCPESNESSPVGEAALAGMCECSKEWIQRQIKPLETRGIIEVLRQHPGDGTHKNRYRIMHPDVLAEAEKELPRELREKPKTTDPFELKKKREGLRSSGEPTQGKKANKLAGGSGQGLISILRQTGFFPTSVTGK